MLPFSLNLFCRPSLTTLTRMRVGGNSLLGQIINVLTIIIVNIKINKGAPNLIPFPFSENEVVT